METPVLTLGGQAGKFAWACVCARESESVFVRQKPLSILLLSDFASVKGNLDFPCQSPLQMLPKTSHQGCSLYRTPPRACPGVGKAVPTLLPFERNVCYLGFFILSSLSVQHFGCRLMLLLSLTACFSSNHFQLQNLSTSSQCKYT